MHVGDVGSATTAKVSSGIVAKTGGEPLGIVTVTPGGPPPRRSGDLFALLSAKPGAARLKAWQAMREGVRRELTRFFAASPLQPRHMGFESVDDMLLFLDDRFANMRSTAGSVDDFSRGIAGWRWNLAGQLFERLVKFHPGLDAYFRRNARMHVGQINDDIRHRQARGDRPLTMHHVQGTAIQVTERFDRPKRVLEFHLVGSDGVPRAFTDFGHIAPNAQGLWLMLPIEIKMPAAFGRIGEQLSSFLPRLAEAKVLRALVDDGNGNVRTIDIDPRAIVVAEHDLAQHAVTLAGKRRLLEAYPDGVLPEKVGLVESIDMATSPTRGVIYYKIRLVVDRDWLVGIVRAITG